MTRAQYADLAVDSLQPELQKQFGELGARSMGGMVRGLAANQAVGLLGRYVATAQTIVLLPGNLKPILRHLGVEERYTRDLLEIVLAHELTHVVQDARHHIHRRSIPLRGDEQTAWVMLVEGHATWVQERVAAELGLNEAAQRLADGMTEANAAASWKGASASQANTRGYLQGKKFVEAVFKKGGLPAVQRLFEQPPRSTSF